MKRKKITVHTEEKEKTNQKRKTKLLFVLHMVYSLKCCLLRRTFSYCSIESISNLWLSIHTAHVVYNTIFVEQLCTSMRAASSFHLYYTGLEFVGRIQNRIANDIAAVAEWREKKQHNQSIKKENQTQTEYSSYTAVGGNGKALTITATTTTAIIQIWYFVLASFLSHHYTFLCFIKLSTAHLISIILKGDCCLRSMADIGLDRFSWHIRSRLYVPFANVLFLYRSHSRSFFSFFFLFLNITLFLMRLPSKSFIIIFTIIWSHHRA